MARRRSPASLTEAHQILRPSTPLAEVTRDALGKDHAETERETWEVRESLHEWDRAQLLARHHAASDHEATLSSAELTAFGEDLLR